MEDNNIEIEVANEISKVEYYFYDSEKIITEENNKTKKIYITPDIIQYDLSIEKSEDDEIIITITTKNQDNISKYQTNLNIKNFIRLSQYFKLLYITNPLFCIDDFYSFIKSKLDNNIIFKKKNIIHTNNPINLINLQNSKVKIIHSDTTNNIIYFIFDIVYVNLRREEIKIELNKIESINDKELINIYQMLLRNKFNYIQRLNHLEKKMFKTQTSLNKYVSIMDKYNRYFEQNMELKMTFLDYGIDTNIFDSAKEYNFIIDILSNLFSEINISLEQIYKASCNGDNNNAFHSYCDGIKNTLILILTDDKRKFGGFTCAEWDKSNKYKYDNKAFLFSLDYLEVYPILDM